MLTLAVCPVKRGVFCQVFPLTFLKFSDYEFYLYFTCFFGSEVNDVNSDCGFIIFINLSSRNANCLVPVLLPVF